MATTHGVGTMVSVVVPMPELLRAAQAVAPHVGKKQNGPGCDRVRLVVDAGAMRLALVSTNGASAAVALVPLLEADDSGSAWDEEVSEVVDLDLSPAALKAVVDIFKRTEAERARVDVPVTRRSVQVTDVSGLLEGRTIRVMALSEWADEGEEQRVDGSRLVLQACALPLAASGVFMMDVGTLSSWQATARALGMLPLRVTSHGRALVAVGSLEELGGFVFLGTMRTYGVGEDSLGVAAYSGPAVAALMELLLHGEPAGGEPALEAEHSVVTEISSWLMSQAEAHTGDDVVNVDDEPGEGGDGL